MRRRRGGRAPGENRKAIDQTEGGLATGLSELATAASVGLRIEFGLDPLGTIASGPSS